MNNTLINIQVRFFAILREITGTSKLSYNIQKGSSVEDVILMLTNEYQELGSHLFSNNQLNSQFVYVVNGEHISSLNNIMKHNDELAILPPSGGG